MSRAVLDEHLIYEILSAVAEIPEGRVASYGQIAALIGRERNARLVGKVLSRAEAYGDYPCHRVVNHAGRLADFPYFILILCVLAVNPDTSAGWMQNRIQMLCKGGLSGTIMPKNCNKVTLFDIQAYIIHSSVGSFHISFFIPSDIFINNLLGIDYSHRILTSGIYSLCYYTNLLYRALALFY